MLYRSRLKVSLIFFIVLFTNFSFADGKKDEFISALLPQIQKAKVEVGGNAMNIPDSLVLAQAIHESMWGKSKLAKQKNNLFGIKKGKNYAKFGRYKDGIKYYLNTLITHNAYKSLRKHMGSNSITLVKYLDNYAEDPRYEVKLAKLIRDNNLMSFDS
jgi:uncharacterized FlgJ-related protein